jgi:hypothetical protein
MTILPEERCLHHIRNDKSRGTGNTPDKGLQDHEATAGIVEKKADTTINAPEREDLRARTPGPDTARR